MTPPSTPLFAFISYSRKDKTVANWLHTKLEKYPYPQDLVSTEFRPPHPRFVRRVFIDTKDLAVTDDSFTYDIRRIWRMPDISLYFVLKILFNPTM